MPDVWAAFDTELYRAASLESEGFIHCSFADQLDAVIERYYNDAKEIIVLEIDTDKLMSRTLNEPSTNNEIYPHIYGPINRDAIVAVKKRRV
jgi:uncharacterized protein (DUF952 family)